MKINPVPQTATLVTLETVLHRLTANTKLATRRKRDLRSAVTCFAKLADQPPGAIALDLAAIRQRLDSIEPAWAKISRKRWANIRSELVAAIDASGLTPMLKTAAIPLDERWTRLLVDAPPRIARAISRFARWASLRRVAPEAVDDSVIERYVAELANTTLVRKLRYVRSFISKRWNELVAVNRGRRLQPVSFERKVRVLRRIPWHSFPAAFRADVDHYLEWGLRPDPLAEDARARALSVRTLRLQREHIHSAASAAVAVGIRIEQLTSLAVLVQAEVFRMVLRHLWQQDGRSLKAYTHGVAITLTAIACEWVKASPEAVATLKALRKKLGKLPSGLTEKNRALLRIFDDPRRQAELVRLPDRLWRQGRRSGSSYAFVALQTALAIDILLHAPLRMANLSAIGFDVHLHWPQGPRRPALITFGAQETKNAARLQFELPTYLADRLLTFRNEIAPALIGSKPTNLFVTHEGKSRSQATIAIAIQKAIMRYLGLKMTPHQFRHLCAKIILDRNPGAYELVRQMLGHSSAKMAAIFYAEIDTMRAGRAHAELINALRESNLGRRRRRHLHRTEE
jgi:integrase